jgi:2-aminoadipate transaminase
MWGRLRGGISARDLLKRAIEHKVTFVAGDIYYADQTDPGTLRLSFATQQPAQITEAVARLARALNTLSASERG